MSEENEEIIEDDPSANDFNEPPMDEIDELNFEALCQPRMRIVKYE